MPPRTRSAKAQYKEERKAASLGLRRGRRLVPLFLGLFAVGLLGSCQNGLFGLVSQKKAYAITVTAGSGGLVKSAGNSSASLSLTANHDEALSLAAVPNADYAFSGWTVSGSGSLSSTSSASTTFTVDGSDATLTASFVSTNALLSNLLVSGGALSGGFSPGTLIYNVISSSSLVFTPVKSISGQRIQYQVNGGSWTDLASGAASASVPVGSTTYFKVTAADGVTSSIYTVYNGTQANVSWTNPTLANNTVTINGPTTLYYGCQADFTLSGYSGTPANYNWYLDGATTPVSTNSTYSTTPTVTSFTYGAHTLMLVVTDSSGISYSGTLALAMGQPTIAPSTGLVGQWLFSDASSGTAIDTSGNGNNLTVNTTHGLLTAVPDRMGNPGHAYSFDGGYLFWTGELTPAIGAFTWSVWFNYGADGAMLINQGGTPGADGVSRSISVSHGTHLLQFYMYNTGGDVCVSSPSAVTTGSWHLAVGVYDGATASLYLDGDLVQQQAFTLGTCGYPEFYVGEQPAYNSYSSIATLDDLRIYSRALSSAEITSLYHAGGN